MEKYLILSTSLLALQVYLLVATSWLMVEVLQGTNLWSAIPFQELMINLFEEKAYYKGILPKGPYLPCASMAGKALLAGYPRLIC